MVVMQRMTDYQGVSLTEAYDNRSVMAQIARIKDRLTAVEQNVDPTLRTDLEAAVSELETLETTVSGIGTQVEANTGSIGQLQTDVGEIDAELAGKADSATVDAALALKADTSDVDADLELKADKTQLTDGSVTKVGTAAVGSDNSSSAGKPVYINNGVPTAMKYAVVDVHNDAAMAGMLCPTKGLKTVSSSSNLSLSNSDEYRWTILTSWKTGGTGQMNAIASVRRSISPYTGGSMILVEGVTAQVVGMMLRWSGVTGSDMTIDMVKAKWNPDNSTVDIYFRVHKSLNSAAVKRHTTCAFFDSAFTADSGGNVSYEDVVQGSDHYPNITNYLQYTWTDIASTWTMVDQS